MHKWAEIAAFVCWYFYEKGFPERQVDLVNAIIDWLEENDMTVPDASELRGWVSLVWRNRPESAAATGTPVSP